MHSSHCGAVRNELFSDCFLIHLFVQVAGYSIYTLPAQLVLSLSKTTQSPTVHVRFHAITVESILLLPPKITCAVRRQTHAFTRYDLAMATA